MPATEMDSKGKNQRIDNKKEDKRIQSILLIHAIVCQGKNALTEGMAELPVATAFIVGVKDNALAASVTASEDDDDASRLKNLHHDFSVFYSPTLP